MKRRVIKKIASIESRVSGRLQDLIEIVKTKTAWQRSNKNRCFESAGVQGDCIKIIAASDKNKEMNGLTK